MFYFLKCLSSKNATGDKKKDPSQAEKQIERGWSEKKGERN